MGLLTFIVLSGFFAWGYKLGAASPCQDVEASDIFPQAAPPQDEFKWDQFIVILPPRNKRGLFVNKLGSYSVKTKPWHIQPVSATTQPLLKRPHQITWIKPKPAEFTKSTQLAIQVLNNSGCKFLTNQEGEPVKFCNKRRSKGKPYCAEHAARCYTTKLGYGMDRLDGIWDDLK